MYVNLSLSRFFALYVYFYTEIVLDYRETNTNTSFACVIQDIRLNYKYFNSP